MSARERWLEETQSAWIYAQLAQCECEPKYRELFDGLRKAADVQAAILLTDVQRAGESTPTFVPSLRARLVVALTRRFGVHHAKPLLAAIKVRGLSAYTNAPPSLQSGHALPVSVGEIGARHRRAGSGGSLRAAVFGVNDGLVSNTSLILGVAGASASTQPVLLAGVAGLLAGAFSMASGEWVSVRSQREMFEFQIGEEREELARYPDEEAEELALIYAARGVPIAEARELTAKLVKDPERALDVLAREELGLNPDNLGSPWSAAASSFTAFALGALVPLVPFLIPSIDQRVVWACTASGVALFAVGVTLSLFTGRNALFGGMRMLLIGAAAGGATYTIGRLLGVSAS